jgi:hypothetical protein
MSVTRGYASIVIKIYRKGKKIFEFLARKKIRILTGEHEALIGDRKITLIKGSSRLIGEGKPKFLRKKEREDG